MCGFVGIFGADARREVIQRALVTLQHRGPDAQGLYLDPDGAGGLGHCRLSILDLSRSGLQPMSDPIGRYHLVFNGEIYNYLELRSELQGAFSFRTQTDSEVLLAAYLAWGEGLLDRLIGMFAFAIWDERDKVLFAARDRFGVKPFYYHRRNDGALMAASEIKALHGLGIPRVPSEETWATYLAYGLYDQSGKTFWKGIDTLPPGHAMRWREGCFNSWKWYDLSERVGPETDDRPIEEVIVEYRTLLEESVRLRFRADVPVGINLSGGLDSSTLLGLVQAVQGVESDISTFTFTTGDNRYDELPWVQQMLERTQHSHNACLLTAEEVPDLAARVQYHQDEPFGGLPTIAYSKVFENARAQGAIVLLDGQGMDEQWAGYDYYPDPANLATDQEEQVTGPVQGSRTRATRPACLSPEFHALAEPLASPQPFPDALRNLQYRDIRYTKIPRALRFNDRISMMHSTELRNPFMDHRLFELALHQPTKHKIRQGTRKWLLRKMVHKLLPEGVTNAPKRPVQTPQREWLRGPLKIWAEACIGSALQSYGGSWLDTEKVLVEWRRYCTGESDNSFYVWQWVNLGLSVNAAPVPKRDLRGAFGQISEPQP